MKQKLLLLLLLVSGAIQSQDFKFSGKIVDAEGEPLESATVYLEKPADSSLVTYTISNADGVFDLSGKAKADKLNLIVSYAGYKPYLQSVTPENKELGQITLNIQDNLLDEVTITSLRAPVSIKSDTLEFNAASFKTREDANLEEVLKELPGVAVDSKGSITVNGKPVSRILVNGKEFFGDDPKIATKNLPKEIIDKIQVVDTKTKSEEFTGKEGDSENKTINITIQEDKNKGYFSRLTGGAGTDDRYELSGIANYFKDKLRVSLLASSNNINSSGFTFDEVFDAMGRSAYSIARSTGGFSIDGNSFGGTSGITKSDNLGFSFANEWPKKTEISTSYFYNNSDNKNAIDIERENILPDRRYFVNSNSESVRLSQNHRFNSSFSFQPDTLTRISVRPGINFSMGESINDSYTESFDEEGRRINTSRTSTGSEVYNAQFSNNLYVSRKFGDRGGYYSVGFRNENQNKHQNDVFVSENEIYNENGEIEGLSLQDQLIEEDTKDDSYTIDLNARLPIYKKWNLDLGFEYENNKIKNERLVYNADEHQEVRLLDDNLSNDFRSELKKIVPSAGLAFRNDTIRFSITAGLLHTSFKNRDIFQNSLIEKDFDNLYLNSYLNYRFSKSKSLYFSYFTRREAPEISKMQPVSIATNPLNIIKGNPDLNPVLTNRLYLNFNNYDWSQKTGFFAYAGGELTNDAIVPVSITDENLVRTTTYTNVDGAYNFYGGLRLDKNFKLDSLSTLKVKPGIRGNLNKRLGFSNSEKYSVKNLSLNPDVSLEYSLDEVFDVETNYTLGINHADYSLNQTTEDYLNHSVSIQFTSYWPEKFVFGSDLNYQKFGNIGSGFKDSFWLWNASLGYKLMGDDGILKLKVFDILDENTATERTTGEDFIQNTQQLVLERYFMLSFTYKFSKFGGKDPNANSRF